MVQRVKNYFDIFIFGFGRVRFSILKSIIAGSNTSKNKTQDETGFSLLNPPPKCVVTHCGSLQSNTRGVSHCGLAIDIKKYLNAKEELQKLKYFTMQNFNLQKMLQKKPKPFKIL
jgi:hypothetical protein